MNRKLIADSLNADPRISQAKHLLKEAVADHQKKLTGIQPAKAELKETYESTLEKFAEYRGGKLWFPYLGSGIGNGPLVELADGSVKYDFISGIGPHYFGHSHSDLIDATVDAAISDTVMQGHLQQNRDSFELAQMFIEASGLSHCFLSSSGAMANENALKIAFQKRFPANRVLAFEKGFAGRTLALSQITDKPAFREGLPSTLAVDYVPFFDSNNPEESTQLAVQVLKKHLSRHPKGHAVMIFELVQGEGGFNIGSTEFFRTLMQILKEHQVAIFVDEIQTFARTESLFAFQHFGIADFVDIVSVGKIAHVCATLFSNEYKPKPGLLSQTFTGSTAAIRATKKILQNLMTGSYYGKQGKNAHVYKMFSQGLEKIAKDNPGTIHGPFGIGSMIAFTPYDGDIHMTTKFVHELFEDGVISFIAGSHPTRVRFLVPAGCVQDQDLMTVLKIIEERIKHASR